MTYKVILNALLLTSTTILATSCNNRLPQTLQGVGMEHVTIGGELAQRVQQNFNRMETPLYQPDQVYWTEQQSGGWPGDKEGRTILALVMDAQASHRTPQYLSELIDRLPRSVNAKGYMGTIYTHEVDEQQLSSHGWLLRGLCEYYAWKKDPKVLEMARKIVDSLFLPIEPFVDRYPLTESERVANVGAMSGTVQNTVNGWRLSSDVGCVFIGMEGLIHSYQYLPSEKSKQLIEKLLTLFERMDLVKIKAQTHASLTAMRGMLRWARLEGDTSLVAQVEKRWALYKEYGMTENYENYNWFERYDTWTEPCAIVDSYLVATQLWAATHNPVYRDDAEKIYLNGLSATQRSNGGFGCDRPTGAQFPDLAIHADEAHWCCTMRGGEGLGRAAEYAYFTHADTLFIPFYHESTLTLPEQRLTLEQHTQYPFSDRIELVIKSAPSKKITLWLPTPEYMEWEAPTCNDQAISARNMQGSTTITRHFKQGDRIVMRYTPKLRWVAFENRDVTDKSLYKAMWGPLVLGYQASAPIEVNLAAKLTYDNGRIGIENQSTELSPLYHLMDSTVSSGAGYHRMVAVKRLP